MDLSCFNWVQLIKKSKLPPNAKYIGMYLSTFMNAEHNIAWPSQQRISDETGLSIRTVIRQLNYLEENNWIIKKKNVHYVNTGKQKYAHNEYIVNVPEDVIRGVTMTPQVGAGVTPVQSRGDIDDIAGVSQCHPNNNVNNNKNNKREGAKAPQAKKVPKKASQIRDDFLPSQKTLEWFGNQGLTIDHVTEHHKFVDHFKSNGKPMKDWDAAWRNWMRRSDEYAKERVR